PDNYTVQVMLGQALYKDGKPAEAIAAFERAAVLFPNATGEGSPNIMIATIAIEQKNTARAIAALEALGAIDQIDIESARKLASLVEPLGDPARTAAAYD